MSSDDAVTKRRKALARTGYRTEQQLDVAAERRAARKSAAGKTSRNIVLSIVAGLILVTLLIAVVFAPRKGTMMFGICRVLLERQLDYPSSLNIDYVEQYPKAVRIGYSSIDSFGQFSLNTQECAFKQGPNAGNPMIIDLVLVNGKEMDHAVVDGFNVSIPAILAYPPDLTLPAPMGTTLSALKRDTT